MEASRQWDNTQSDQRKKNLSIKSPVYSKATLKKKMKLKTGENLLLADLPYKKGSSS